MRLSTDLHQAGLTCSKIGFHKVSPRFLRPDPPDAALVDREPIPAGGTGRSHANCEVLRLLGLPGVLSGVTAAGNTPGKLLGRRLLHDSLMSS